MFRSPPPRRKAKDITGDKHIAQALHAILQQPGMPVNAITNRAVQVMVDMMRDLMERVMDEAAACADNNGRITIKSGNIMTGARLAMHQNIGPYGGGCPEIEKSMCAFATQRYTDSLLRSTTSIWGGRSGRLRRLQEEPLPSPLPIGPGRQR